MFLAGLPITVVFDGIDFVTTAPAPTTQFSPMVIPGKITAPAPMDAPSSITVRRGLSKSDLLLGYLSFVKTTFGPTKTPLPILNPFHIETPFFTVTRSPIITSDSMKQWAPILQFAPIDAPWSTMVNCQIRVSSPISFDSTNEVGWNSFS